jgi:hypothetical protein
MDKKIFAPLFRNNEAEAFLVAKPFYRSGFTLCHVLPDGNTR